MPPSHHPTRLCPVLVIKRRQSSFLGEGQAIGIGSPAWEPIPDYTSILENVLDPLQDIQRQVQVGQVTRGQIRPGVGKIITQIPVGMGIPRGRFEVPTESILPPLLQSGRSKIGKILTSPTRGPQIPVRPNISTEGRPRLKVSGEEVEVIEVQPGIFIKKPKSGIIQPIRKQPVNKRRTPVQVVQPTRPQVSISPTRITRVGLTTNQPRTQPMALDLGSLIQQAVGGYTDYQIAKLQQPALFPFDQLSNLVSPDTSQPIIYAAPCKRRKRRRRLATPSDIKDLAALSSVTTPSEKKTWIATHPS